MTNTYKMQPKDYKLPKGYFVNINKEYKQMLEKYPTFESIKVGNITMSSKYKENMKGEIEDRKTAMWYHWQATKALSYIDTMINLYAEPEYNYEKLSPGAYLVAKEKIESDIKGYKEDIAKAEVWYNLIKLEKERAK